MSERDEIDSRNQFIDLILVVESCINSEVFMAVYRGRPKCNVIATSYRIRRSVGNRGISSVGNSILMLI